LELRIAARSYLSDRGNQRRGAMPVFILWAVPAVFVLGGLTYLIVK
jgi:hypothetical protein